MPAFVNKDECVGCEVCVDECESGALTMKDGVAVVDTEKCDECESCIEACPTECISMK
jgi:ferredoxin